MKSQIIEKIDRLSLEVSELPEDVLWLRADQVFQNKYQVLEAVDYFLEHLIEDHNIPGSVWDTLIGIGDWIREDKPLTNKQERYVVLSLCAYWDQRDYRFFEYF